MELGVGPMCITRMGAMGQGKGQHGVSVHCVSCGWRPRHAHVGEGPAGACSKTVVDWLTHACMLDSTDRTRP